MFLLARSHTTTVGTLIQISESKRLLGDMRWNLKGVISRMFANKFTQTTRQESVEEEVNRRLAERELIVKVQPAN